MKKRIIISILACFAMVFYSCNSNQSLQEYFIENAENEHFLSLTLPKTLIPVGELDLQPAQIEAYNSIDKINILVFKNVADNPSLYTTERQKIKDILKDDAYEELINLGSKGMVKYKGDDDTIDEAIFFMSDKKQGFIIARLLGNDMDIAQLSQLSGIVQNKNFNMSNLTELNEFLRDMN